MTAPADQRSRFWLGAALALTALKLWLTRGQGIYALGSAGLDDRLFLELGQHLTRGEWLGPYNELTLAKGPFYSLFIAAVYAIGVPLFLAQQVFYAGACALFTRALRPAVTPAGARLLIYTLLLWNPMTFDAPAMGRVLRQHVYGPLALMIFAGLIALYLRRTAPGRRQAPWALLLGLAAGCFYLTREETIWLAPSALLLAGTYMFGAGKISGAAGRRAAALLTVALLAAALPVLLVCTQNKRHYGWFGTCEIRATEFKDAYGAMLRVRVGPELPYVPITREARTAMAGVSPAFATLQQQFDGGIAEGWAGSSEFLTHLPPSRQQIGGGWMVWALREAAARAGYHGSADQALAFYNRLAHELNRACADGRLPAGPPRSGFLPPWREADTGPFLQAVRDFADFTVSFSRFSARPPASSGSPEELQLFRDLTHERISPPAGELDTVGAARYLLNARKVEWLQAIGKSLRPILLGLLIAAQLVALLRVAQSLWRRTWGFPLTVAAAAWGAGVASLVMHAMIEVTSFPVLTISSFAPIYPLLLVFIIAALWDASGALTARRGAPAAPPAAFPLRNIPLNPRVAGALPWLAGLAALAPFLIWHRQFRELFWFADDLFLVDQMATMGLVPWMGQVFSENFVPLFKLLWGGAVLVFDGSYPAMLWLLWLTHALNTVVFGRLLTRAGFPWLAVMASQLVFALSPANLETLGWSVQWSAVLATTFLLLALAVHERHADQAGGFLWKLHPWLALLSAASACSFSRGVLTGPVLALALLLPLIGTRDARAWLARAPGALLCLLPAVAVALLISHNSSGNHQQMAGHWGAAFEFGASYFLLNPGHLLLGCTTLHPAALLLLAAAKLAVVGSGLLCTRGRVRALLLLLLAYDLGNAVLVGIGRYHTGFLASMSSRYQYSSLLATLPFVAILLAAGLDRVLTRDRPRQWAAAVLLAGLAGGSLAGWPAELAGFTGWRGTELRRVLSAPATDDPAARVPALEFMHVERAKALIRAYHLH